MSFNSEDEIFLIERILFFPDVKLSMKNEDFH